MLKVKHNNISFFRISVHEQHFFLTIMILCMSYEKGAIWHFCLGRHLALRRAWIH